MSEYGEENNVPRKEKALILIAILMGCLIGCVGAGWAATRVVTPDNIVLMSDLADLNASSIYSPDSGVGSYSYLISTFTNATGTFYQAMNGSSNKVIDSWTSTDASATFNNITANAGATNQTIYWSKGDYPITAKLLYNANSTKLLGAGENLTRLIGQADLGTDPIMMVGNYNNHDIEIGNIGFEGTSMDRTAPYTTARKAIEGSWITNIYVHDVAVNGTPATGVGLGTMSGDVVIERCRITNCGTASQQAGSNGLGIGTSTNSTDYVRIVDNYVKGIANNGILIENQYDTTGVYAWDYVFTGNTVINCGRSTTNAAGISILSVSNAQIEGNHLIGNGIGIIFSTPEWLANHQNPTVNSTIKNNYIADSVNHGVKIASSISTNITIKNNDIYRSGFYGIYLNSSGAIATSNNLVENVQGNIYIVTGLHPVIQYNQGFVTENSGSTAGCLNGTWIAHGLASTPTSVIVTLSGTNYIDGTSFNIEPSVIASNSTHFQVSLLKWVTNAVGVVGSTKTVNWEAFYVP